MLPTLTSRSRNTGTSFRLLPTPMQRTPAARLQGKKLRRHCMPWAPWGSTP